MKGAVRDRLLEVKRGSVELDAALVPPPRIHSVRYHGVFAPNSRVRARVVPAPAVAPEPAPSPPSSVRPDPVLVTVAGRPFRAGVPLQVLPEQGNQFPELGFPDSSV